MTGDYGWRKPTNKIVVAGCPLVANYKVEDATTMYAGRLVIKGTTDADIKVCPVTATSYPTGWLGYEQTSPSYRPATVDTIYLINSYAAVLSGGGFIIVASLATGTPAKGAPLCQAAAGEVTSATTMTALVPTGSTTVLATSAAPTCTMGGALLPQGIIVGYMEMVGATGDVLVRSAI